MATIILMHWPGVTPEQYQQARRVVNWEGNLPKWAEVSRGVVRRGRLSRPGFVRDRLTPGVQAIGIQGQPSVQFETATAVFAPNP